MIVKAPKNKFFGKNPKKRKKRKKPTTFFNPETDPDLDQKPTFEQKRNPDPDRSTAKSQSRRALWITFDSKDQF
jgi:hypothetical protein